MYWELSTAVLGLIVLGASLTEFIEVLITVVTTPCEGWNKMNSQYPCPFEKVQGSCGLMSNVWARPLEDTFYFESTKSVCHSTLSIQAATIVFFLFFFIVLIKCLVKDNCAKSLPTAHYFTFQNLCMLIGIVWLGQLVNVSGVTSGYVKTCDALGLPKCKTTEEFTVSRYRCHLGKLDNLPKCNTFANESFMGRLRIALGMSWVGFIAMTCFAAITLYRLRMEVNNQKEIIKKRFEERRLYATNYPAIYPLSNINQPIYECNGHQVPYDDQYQQHDDQRQPYDDQTQPYDEHQQLYGDQQPGYLEHPNQYYPEGSVAQYPAQQQYQPGNQSEMYFPGDYDNGYPLKDLNPNQPPEDNYLRYGQEDYQPALPPLPKKHRGRKYQQPPPNESEF